MKSTARQESLGFKLSKKKIRALIAQVFLGGLLVLALSHWAEGWLTFAWSKIAAHTAAGLGEALVIAALLAWTVDRYLKSEFFYEAAREISPFMQSAHQPAEVQREVRHLCNLALYRRQMKAVYTFSQPDGPESPLRLQQELSFSVVNSTDKTGEFTHETTVLGSPENEGRVEMVSGSGDFEEDDYLIRPNSEPGRDFSWRRKLNLHPGGVGDFETHTSRISPEDDEDVLLLNSTTLGLHVEAKNYSAVPLDFTVVIGHRLNPTAMPKDMPSRWSLQGCLTEGSAMVLQWRPRSSRSLPDGASDAKS